MNFGVALKELKEGNKLARVGWNSSGQYLELQVPDEHSKMALPYLYISTMQGHLVPWVASQIDLLAKDWRVVT